MKINRIDLKNYRCFEEISLELHPKFNLIVGVNGTGKTAILEAIRIAIGSLFLGVDKYKDKISTPKILKDDVRLSNLEQQYPVIVNTVGEIHDFSASNDIYTTLEWQRSLEKKGGATRYTNAKQMQNASTAMQEKIRDTKSNTNIPIVAYYSTDRYKKERKNIGVKKDGSRLRGYYNALDAMTNIKFFLDLWFTETLYELQNSTQSPMLRAVSEAIKNNISNCEDLIFDVKMGELIITLKKENGEIEKMPFHMLSDGVRSMLAMVMEIAFRCYLLNPHLNERAAKETSGIVLIDEIDLHLHPEWQKKVITDIQRTFPNIQFIVTTHAPLVIGSLTDGKIYTIENKEVFDFPLQHGRDANHILREMGSSEMDELLNKQIQKYFILIEEGKGKYEEALLLRIDLQNRLGNDHTQLQRADLMLKLF